MAVGSGKHLRLRLQAPDGTPVQAIFFSAGRLSAKLRPGDRVDAAFTPQINEFRGRRTVQLNLRRCAPTSCGRWPRTARTSSVSGTSCAAPRLPERSCARIPTASACRSRRPLPGRRRRAAPLPAWRSCPSSDWSACSAAAAPLRCALCRTGRTHWKTACCSARFASSKQVIEWKPFRNTISA